MITILLNIAIILELIILYCMYTFTQSIPWCQYDASYIDRMIDKIENKTQN